jgi:hypothetical protein
LARPTPFGPGRANAGASGAESFGQIEEKGTEASLAGLCEELVANTHRTDPVRRLGLAKLVGGERPFGLPTIWIDLAAPEV